MTKGKVHRCHSLDRIKHSKNGSKHTADQLRLRRVGKCRYQVPKAGQCHHQADLSGQIPSGERRHLHGRESAQGLLTVTAELTHQLILALQAHLRVRHFSALKLCAALIYHTLQQFPPACIHHLPDHRTAAEIDAYAKASQAVPDTATDQQRRQISQHVGQSSPEGQHQLLTSQLSQTAEQVLRFAVQFRIQPRHTCLHQHDQHIVAVFAALNQQHILFGKVLRQPPVGLPVQDQQHRKAAQQLRSRHDQRCCKKRLLHMHTHEECDRHGHQEEDHPQARFRSVRKPGQ